MSPMSWPSVLRVLKISQTAQLLSIDPDSVAKLCRQGELETVTVLSTRRVSLRSIKAYLVRHGLGPV